MSSLACSNKQPSTIETELDTLRNRVYEVNRIIETIGDIVWIPAPENCKEAACKQSPLTLADHIRAIGEDVDITFGRLESIKKCLEEQLGCLKLAR